MLTRHNLFATEPSPRSRVFYFIKIKLKTVKPVTHLFLKEKAKPACIKVGLSSIALPFKEGCKYLCDIGIFHFSLSKAACKGSAM